MSDRAEMEKEYNKWQAEREDSVKKEKSQIPNTNGKDRTDIVKSSQLGFEVPEVGKQGEAS